MLEPKFGPRLKELRGKIKAQSVADKAGVGASAISKIENGKQHASEEVVKAYASLLKVSVDELLERIEPRRQNRLFGETITFVSGDVWSLVRDGPAQRVESAVLKQAVNQRQMAQLLAHFVRSGSRADSKNLTLWFYSPPYTGRDTALTEQLLDAYREALQNECRVLYVSVDGELERFHGSHLKAKLLLGMLARHMEVTQRLADDDRVKTRSIPPLSAAPVKAVAARGADANNPALKAFSPITPCDIAYWRGHSLFMALPSTSASHAEVGVVLPLDATNSAPFDLNADFLDAQSTDTGVFTRSSECGFWDLWSRLELAAGNQAMVQRFFSSMTRSAYFYRENDDDPWFQWMISRLQGHVSGPASEAKKLASRIRRLRRERAIAFQTRLASHKFRQVCDGKAIERWLATGERPDTAHSDANPGPDSRDEMVMRLSGILELMERNRNVELAITDRFDAVWSSTPLEQKQRTDVSWIVNDNDVLAIERQEYDHQEYGETRIVIESASVADAFRDQFEDGWGGLRPEENDRRQVMEKLRAWVTRLEAGS